MTRTTEPTEPARCAVCGAPIEYVTEPHWSGWLDEEGDQLSCSPSLHDHAPAPGCRFSTGRRIACHPDGPIVRVTWPWGEEWLLCEHHHRAGATGRARVEILHTHEGDTHR